MRERHAKQRSDQDIAGEVDACVDARVRHDGGEGSQGQGEPGLGGCGSGRGPRSGRRRLPSGFSAAFTTTEVTAIEVSPSKAARRPLPPPPSASSPAVPIQILE